MRLDTYLDVSQAVVRYLELLKLAALHARPEGQDVADALPGINAAILHAATGQQREILLTSSLDDVLLGAERASAAFAGGDVDNWHAYAINAQSPQDQAQAENVLSGALKSLFAVAEAYPDLKANQNFLSLQEELTSTEDRVAYARQFYNDSVLSYNNKLQTFPRNVIAGMFNFEKREYFEGEPEATGPVRVEF